MSPGRAHRSVALTIAGSDSGGGAGIQADLKAFAAHGVYGTSALTLVTAQNTRGVQGVLALDPEFVAKQIHSVLSDFPVAAVKTGALGNAGIISAVAESLAPHGLPLVVDPVMIAKSGDALLDADALDALRARLLPLATLVTPNIPEAERLLGLTGGHLHTPAALEAHAAHPLPFPVLLKGGHLEGNALCDHLRVDGAHVRIPYARQDTRHTHGTGCTISAAITARLARGEPLESAVRGAHAYTQAAIRHAPNLGGGVGPLEHFPEDVC